MIDSNSAFSWFQSVFSDPIFLKAVSMMKKKLNDPNFDRLKETISPKELQSVTRIFSTSMSARSFAGIGVEMTKMGGLGAD